jgi:CRISPR-associated endonuclease Cas1
MQTQAYRARHLVGKSPRVLTVTGQGVSLRVRRYELQVTDKFPLEGPQDERNVTRATCPMDRLLFLAGSGAVSVSALDWLAENGVPVVACDQSGRLRWTLTPGAGGVGQGPLRRAQALAPFTDAGPEIARWLILRKVRGEREVLLDVLRRLAYVPHDSWPHTTIPAAAKALEALLPRIEQAHSIAEVRILESDAADVYWRAWIGLPLHFAPASYRKSVPRHWHFFSGRGSPLNNGNRNAANPGNACLNYAFALLEAEVLVACHEAGLDPYLSILHTDQETRQSLLYDIMEPVRPVAERLVLSFLLSHAFKEGEVYPQRDGRCRLDQDVCALLWPWMPTFRQALGPVMSFLLSRLRQGPKHGERIAYRLVEVAPSVRTRVPLGQKRWAREAPAPAIRAYGVCRSCGVLIEGEPDRLYCDDCLPARRQEANAATLRAGPEMLRRLRDAGQDPAHGGAAAEARREMLSLRMSEALAWEREHSRTDPEVFRRKILPVLRRVTVRRIAKATGLTTGYSSMIRRGVYVPHPRHWEALRSCGKSG